MKHPSASVRRINYLIGHLKLRSYLEVGVARGDTFLEINTDKKYAVDPKFKFEFEKYKDQKQSFFEMPSDDFFSDHCFNLNEKFDLIFLDGLHTFEQTLRDFCSSLRFSHDETIWLLDDTVPT
ncbi:MAG: class I SAM-dependent methyltransferase, partial [Symploca sp. SIO2B6]|nr:class I SAM-dependent methyltransferase [Symploca sp. SIO2B6]